MTAARAWAVKTGNDIDPRTVQDSRVGAMVNWLMVGAGISVMRGTSDSTVEAAFRTYAMPADAALIEVLIQETRGT